MGNSYNVGLTKGYREGICCTLVLSKDMHMYSVSSRRPPSNIDKGVRTVSQGGRAVVKANALGVAATCIKYVIFY